MFEELFKDMKKSSALIAGDDEFFATLATIYWKMYTSLTKVGFSDEEAMKIVAQQGMSLKSNVNA